MDRLSTKGQMIDQIDLRGVPHSGFDRSNHNYLTGKLGAIIPTRLDEVYPGDRIKGIPQAVANFEPLAAPLMGSMVMKQEAFFVPLPQVWRRAYDFFTGKNGFAENIPSLSPRDIFNVYNSNYMHAFYNVGDEDDDEGFGLLVKMLNAYYHDVDDRIFSEVNGVTLLNLLKAGATEINTIIQAIYGPRKMSDLLQPIYNHYLDFINSEQVKLISVSFEEHGHTATESDIMDFCGLLGDVIREFHDFIFGPSSLMDYLGWPITTPNNYKIDAPIIEHGITDIFSYACWRNVLVLGSYDLESQVNDLFSEIPLNFLPFKANYLIWYWNYRDQLLETDILDPEDDEFTGAEITENVVLYTTILRQRCWFKDAYTTALTNTGDGNLLVPVGSPEGDTILYEYYDAEGTLLNTSDYTQALNAGAAVCIVHNGDYSYRVPMNYLRGSLSNSGDPSSNEGAYLSLDLFDRIKRLRSFVMKKLILGYEVDDVIWSSFMVKLSNVRMHVPEILGRGRDAVEISTLVNNTSTSEQIAGDKTATAWCKGSISEINYFAEEWGFYMQYMTILPIQSYAGGMQRLYMKLDSFDYMWPEFATMGMDAIYNYELAQVGSRLTDTQGLRVFGYNGRYYDLKYRQDEEHGRLLTDLNYLTFSREFDSENLPKLNYMFVHCWPRLDGFVISSPLVDVFRCDVYTGQGWERRLPVPSNFVS